MRAVRIHEFGAPEVMKVEDVPDPVAGPGEVLIKIEAIGVNPVDTYIRAGAYAVLPELPYTPGGDAAGTVEALGKGVSGFAVGDRVYMAGIAGGRNYGATAEKAAVPEDVLFPLPGNTDFAAGAALGVPYATAYYGLFMRGQAKPGQSLFVHGASGAVGTAALQMARGLGMTVIGSAGTDKGRQLVLDQGAHHVLDHTSEGYIEELRGLTGGSGPDLILEMLANVNLAKDLDVIAKYGRIVIIGNRGEIEINPRATMMKNIDVVGLAFAERFLGGNAVDPCGAGGRFGMRHVETRDRPGKWRWRTPPPPIMRCWSRVRSEKSSSSPDAQGGPHLAPAFEPEIAKIRRAAVAQAILHDGAIGACPRPNGKAARLSVSRILISYDTNCRRVMAYGRRIGSGNPERARHRLAAGIGCSAQTGGMRRCC